MTRILKDEWKRLQKPASFLVGCLLIFSLIFFLYGTPTEPILYGLVIVLVLGGISIAADLFVLLRKYEKLQKLKSDLDGAPQEMPPASNGIELLYQDMLTEVWRQRQTLEYQQSKGYTDLTDYYTLWVHQIKTPLAALQLLLQSAGAPDIRRMEIELFKIEQYVEMVLGYLRTEDLSTDLQIQECDLDKIICQGVKKYAKMFILENISLDYTPVHCQIITDEKWLLFVFEQILSNALKYTRAKGRISIYMDPQKENTLVIEDTGIGILPQDLPRIWEKGFTGYNGRKDKRATGIGLYSSKKILDRLSHTMYVTSRVNVGTKVYLDLHRKKLDLI